MYCRERSGGTKVPPSFVTKTPWTGTVEVVGEQDPFGGTRTINISNGTFTDEFVEEQVHIYKFSRPTPYYAAE